MVRLENSCCMLKRLSYCAGMKTNEFCPDCGHFLDGDGECANCWKEAHIRLHGEFGNVYSTCRTFIKDWRDGDFQLPRLAEIHATKIEEMILATEEKD